MLGGLLAIELGGLSLVGDLPESGPAATIVPIVRMAMTVALAAIASAWIMARVGSFAGGARAEPPPHDARPAIAAHAVIVAATAAITFGLMRRGAEPVGLWGFLLWIGSVGATAVSAVAVVAPLGWTIRTVARRWRLPLVALAAGVAGWRVLAHAEQIWGFLSSWTLQAVAWSLALFFPSVRVDLATSALAVESFEVEIASECSGVDGIGFVVLFLGIWIALARRHLRADRALLLLPAGAIAAVLGNVVRIAALVAVGATGREELALGAFHSRIGWVFFACIALACVTAAERIPWLRREPEGPDEGDGPAAAPPPHAAAHVAPLLAAVGTAYLTGAVSPGAADPAYALRIVVPLVVLAYVWRDLPRPLLTWSWRAAGIGLAVGAGWILFVQGDGAALPRELAEMQPATRWSWIAARALGSTLLIPLVEELAFRGFLLPWIAARRPAPAEAGSWSWPAVLLSSIAFGLLHSAWLAGALAGVAFAAARQLRGKLGDAVLAHVVSNAAVTAAVLLGGRWDLWS